MKKRLWALPVLAAALLAGCAPAAAGPAGAPPSASAPAALSVQAESEPAASVPEETAPAPPVELGDDVFAFRFEVAGVAAALPYPAAALAAHSIRPLASEREALEPGQSAEVPFETPDGPLTLSVANLGERARPLAECEVVGVTGDAAGPASLRLPGGLGLGSARAEVLALCGAPDGDDAETAAELSYGAWRGAWLRFTFGGSGGVTAFRLQCTRPPAAPPRPEALPPEARAWQPPAELGEDPWLYRLRYGGDMYSLPAPVAAFLENGWVLHDEGEIEAGGWLRGASLRRGNQVLRTVLYNFSATAQPLAGCFVAMVESSKASLRLPLETAGGLSEASTRAEVEALLGRPASIYRSMNGTELIFTGPNGRYVARFSPEDEATLIELEVWHEAL